VVTHCANDVVRRAIYSNPNNRLNAEGSGVNGFV
jgi:hypothetical protein